MKRFLSILFTLIFLLSLTACNGYNRIMRNHLNNENNYHVVEATFCSYTEAKERIYLRVSIEDKSAFDPSETYKEEIILQLVGDNCNILREALSKEEIRDGDRITVKCSTWIYMDSTFYYIAEMTTQNQTLLSFDDGLKNIIKHVNNNKFLL